MTGLMGLASFNYFLLLVGFFLRKSNRRAHAGVMTTAIVSDVGLVLYLQFQRNAVATALAFKLSYANQAHIFFSTLAAVLYVPVLGLGYRLLTYREGAMKWRATHIRLGIAALVFRSLGFLLMFSMIKDHGF